jgi:DNA repair exonuclease SbcCD ATPase subunit
MIDLTIVKTITGALDWLLTLGARDVKHVKEQIKELISHLSASAVSLWDATKEISRLQENQFNKQSFIDVYDYFTGFYFAPEHISAARTHCTVVARDLERIKFKLAKILRTDLGKWKEADTQFQAIIDADEEILKTYQTSIEELKTHLDQIKADFDARRPAAAKKSYFGLKEKVRSDLNAMKKTLSKIEAAYNHIERIAG